MSEPALTKVHQGFSYRLDPTPAQRQLLASHTGASRFCHNFLLGLILANWKENRERKEAGEEVEPAWVSWRLPSLDVSGRLGLI